MAHFEKLPDDRIIITATTGTSIQLSFEEVGALLEWLEQFTKAQADSFFSELEGFENQVCMSC